VEITTASIQKAPNDISTGLKRIQRHTDELSRLILSTGMSGALPCTPFMCFDHSNRAIKLGAKGLEYLIFWIKFILRKINKQADSQSNACDMYSGRT
jgi:hypothetical protein